MSDGLRAVSYSYAGVNLTAFTDALGQGSSYVYDKSGVQDTAGHLTKLFYPSHPANPFVINYFDGTGKVQEQADANGNLTQAFFAGARSEIIDPVGNSHVWYLDPAGNVTTEIQDYGPAPHANITTTNAYDSQYSLLSKTEPEGDSFVYTYDQLFKPLTITHFPKPGSPLSPVVQSYTYTVPVASLPNFEQVRTFTDGNGNVTFRSYDSATGNLTTVDQPAIAPLEATSETPEQVLTYTSIGLPQTVQDAAGRITRYEYDAKHADETIKVTVDYGRLNLTTQYGYDSFGDVTSVTDANGNTTTTTFDKLRRTAEVDAPVAGIVTSYSYFPNGQVKTITRNAVAPEVTQYSYTFSDEVQTVVDAAGNMVTTTYDPDDRVRTVTQQVSSTQNRQKSFVYDPLGRMLQASDTTAGSLGQVLEAHSYTPNGRDLSFTDANNHATVYVYNGLDQLVQTQFPDQTTQVSQWDANGNLLRSTTRSGQTIDFTYNALNLPVTKNPQGETAGQVNFVYDLTGRLVQAADQSGGTPYRIGYDSAGRPVSYTDQQGRTVKAGFDNVGNRTLLQWPAGTNGTDAWFATFKFDALNRMAEIDENGLSTKPLAKYTWDTLSRPSLIVYGDGSTDASTYDAADNLQTLSLKFPGGQDNVTFTYGWLKNHQRQSTAVSNSIFQYVPASGITNYAPADVNNGYTSASGTIFSYDGNRNLTSDGLTRFVFDVEKRLIQAQSGGEGQTEYLYDPLSHRKQKQTNGVTTQFVLAGDEEVADYEGTGIGFPQMLTVRGAGGLPVAAVTPTNGGNPEMVVYYHHEVLGSSVAATSAGQSGAEAFSYSEFGVPGAGDLLPYRFAGYRYDQETGLYYLRARYYSPDLARFLEPDPAELEGGSNLYAYAGNDPINNVDPLGLWQVTIVGGAGYGGELTFGHNSNQWNVGVFGGVAEGAAFDFNPANLSAGASGLNGSIISGSELRVGKAASVALGISVPVLSPSEPLEYEIMASRGSVSTGVSIALEPDGETTSFAPQISTGVGEAAYFLGGLTYTFGNSVSNNSSNAGSNGVQPVGMPPFSSQFMQSSGGNNSSFGIAASPK